MKWDVFCSICQMVVDGKKPSEEQMLRSFFRQAELADQLGYDIVWVAESHLSSQVQKQNPHPVIPDFEGEIGLNTDILQLAHRVFALNSHIEVGSAIRNILCNGGPLAHAEAIKTFLALRQLDHHDARKIHIGFAAGRFPYSNAPYGIIARDPFEKQLWPAIRSQIFLEATEIFLRALTCTSVADSDIPQQWLTRESVRTDEEWSAARDTFATVYGPCSDKDRLPIQKRWTFDRVGVIPFEAPLEQLRLVIGSHDPRAHTLANQFLPCGVFNLSITPADTIERTHARMQSCYHAQGGAWTRDLMPRTALVFLENTSNDQQENDRKAQARAEKAIAAYWRAMQATIDPAKITSAVDNALAGSPETVAKKIRSRFHPEDRIMLWFDFNTHDQRLIHEQMRCFMEEVVPLVDTAFSTKAS